MYEKIDEWLFKTEQYQNQISLENSDGKIFVINAENEKDKREHLSIIENGLIKIDKLPR